MAGNVSEWVNDWFDRTYYETSPPKNPPVRKREIQNGTGRRMVRRSPPRHRVLPELGASQPNDSEYRFPLREIELTAPDSVLMYKEMYTWE